jgi:hypothetical protein
MKIIKKLAVLSAAITAMAAFVVPSMASAVVWGPLNSNQSLDSTNVSYAASGGFGGGWTCSSQHLGVHVRTPASSSIDITSASWSGCVGTGSLSGTTVTIIPTGLPWVGTATSTTAVSFPVHYQMTYSFTGGPTANVDGTMTAGGWNAATHTLSYTSSVLIQTYMGMQVAYVGVNGSWRNPTQVLTLT